MSMHEFEDLVEMSIRCLVQSQNKNSPNLRSLFWNLYQFQEAWDTGFTQLRVLDTLLEHRYVYRFNVAEHPDYETYKSALDGLKDFDFISLNPEQKWDQKTNPTAGFYQAPYLYCEAGSPLWQRMVEAGRLQAAETQPPAQIDIVVLTKAVVDEAREQGDKALISMWFTALGVYVFSFYSDEQLEALKFNPSVKEIKQTVKRTKALKSDAGYGYLKQPTRNQIKQFPFMVWWYKLNK